MNIRMMNGLADATRLTREGRLSEAMDEIRRTLGSTVPSSDGAPVADRSARGAFVPPSLPPFAPAAAAAGLRPAAPAPGGAVLGRDLLRRGEVSPPVPSGARFEDRHFSGSAGSLRYKLYVPRSYDGRALPLVVMLHGCTQSPDDFAAGTRMNELAEEHGLLVAYPAQAQSANPSRCWNWFKTSEQRRESGEPALIA
jgi:hypothetical protein